MKSFLAFLILLLLTPTTFAAKVAVIDSGTDYRHVDLAKKMWANPVEIAGNNRDEDGNGYQDDIRGWNFAENNNQVIDYSYLNTFNNDVYRFFEIQSKSLTGRATQAEKDWMKKQLENDEFRKDLTVFANFTHGTHVSGIVAQDANQLELMAIKLLPTEVKLPFPIDEVIDQTDGFRMTLVKAALDKLAEQQSSLLHEVGEFVGFHKMDVANGSFGTGINQAYMLAKPAFQAVFFREPKQEELDEVASAFLQSLNTHSKKMVDASPGTLFVFASGNDGSDNDKFPASPASIKASNVITVAAILDGSQLAMFSNYGANSVDLAAPGVAIKSTAPGDKYMFMNGTSQAAPYVANIAARMKDLNLNLTAVEIKRILLETVDKRRSMTGKLKTDGTINGPRALLAAEKSLEWPLFKAIDYAKNNIGVAEFEINMMTDQLDKPDHSTWVAPLPGLFAL